MGVADTEQTRSVGWGDYNADGHLDLYVGFSGGSQTGPSFIGNRLYRNDGDGKHFTDVTQSVGLELEAGGVSRQISFVDYDNDGDVDLFVAFRGRPDHLFRNDDGKFTDVTKSMRDDPGSSMGAVWFDFDEDGDLDMYLANMDGYANCFYRNDGGSFVEVAQELGLDTGGREIAKEPGSHDFGSIRPDLIDYDNDGDLDIYMTNLGTVDGLYRNDGNGQFVNVSDQVGLTNDGYRGTATWADFDNDGRIDVYVLGTVYRNEGNAFRDVTPSVVSRGNVGGYGVQSADFDGLMEIWTLAPVSSRNHYLFRNLLGTKTPVAVLCRCSFSMETMPLHARRLGSTALPGRNHGICSEHESWRRVRVTAPKTPSPFTSDWERKGLVSSWKSSYGMTFLSVLCDKLFAAEFPELMGPEE